MIAAIPWHQHSISRAFHPTSARTGVGNHCGRSIQRHIRRRTAEDCILVRVDPSYRKAANDGRQNPSISISLVDSYRQQILQCLAFCGYHTTATVWLQRGDALSFRDRQDGHREDPCEECVSQMRMLEFLCEFLGVSFERRFHSPW